MSTHNYIKDANLGLLIKEIQDSSITAVIGGIIPLDNGTIDIVFETTLSGAEETTLDALIISHVKPAEIQGHHVTITFEGSQIASGAFTKAIAFIYEGTDEVGVPYEGKLLGYVDTDTTGEVRLYDKTNGVVVGSKTFSNSSEDAIDLTLVGGSWPTGPAIIEVQAKRVSGTGNKKVYLNSMIIGY